MNKKLLIIKYFKVAVLLSLKFRLKITTKKIMIKIIKKYTKEILNGLIK
jgi:hypothetical protein